MHIRIVGMIALMFVLAACASAPTPSVTSVAIDQDDVSLLVGDSATLTATVVAVGSASQDVTWSIGPAGVATVDPATGAVTAASPGDATITATSTFDATKSDTVALNVQSAPAITSVTIDQGPFTLGVGETTNLTATVVAVASASQEVTWSISPAGVATIDPATGLVTAVAPGDAVITATSTFDATKSDTLDVKVTTVTATFFESAVITIPDFGAATPYPATIAVAGMPATLVSVTVTLIGMTHTFPDDIDVLLVGPGGEATLLMSDTGGGTNIVDVTLTFSMEATESLPDSVDPPILSQPYLPTNFETNNFADTIPDPAPAGPYEATLDVFTGTDPNGTWSLFVADDSGADAGNIAGGWSITIEGQ